MKGAFRFIQVSFVFTTSSHPVDALENAFDNAEDWLRIADHLWILYSDADLRTWRNRIKRVAGLLSTDTFFLSEFTEGEYSGYQLQATWDWLLKLLP